MTSARVNEIDLLRFIAALSVVFFHYAFRGYAADLMTTMPYPILAPISKYGYLGVELFFIISGFVILMTAANGSLRGFVVSRIVRLYPAFWACCTISFAVTIAIGTPWYSATIGQYLANMTMLSEFVGVPSIDGVYWSLFVEMRFYAFVAVVLLIGKIHQAQSFIIFWLITSVMLEILHLGKLRYLLLVGNSAYFIAGATYFLIWSQGITLTRVCIIIVSWLLAVYQSVTVLPIFEKHYKASMNPYVVAGVITGFFFIMLFVSLRRTGSFGQKRWLLVGALTYPLYLLHQNIGFMVFNIAYPSVNSHLLFWGTIVTVLALAFAVHIFVEKRFSLHLKNFINRVLDHAQLFLKRA